MLSPCTSPKTYNGLPRGEHTFEVRVMVPDEAPEGEITTYAWTIADLSPPVTTIEFGPAEGSTVHSQTATFAFDSSDPSATFECRLDNAATFTACPVPSVYTNLSQGEHTLRVQSISQYGIRGTIAQRTWTVIPDTTAPVTQIIDAPTGQVEYVEGMEGIISFVSEAGATFECSLDNEPFSECTSPYEYADLEIGAAQLPRPRDRPRGQHRESGGLRQLGGHPRHDGAGDAAARQAAARRRPTSRRRSPSRRTSSAPSSSARSTPRRSPATAARCR